MPANIPTTVRVLDLSHNGIDVVVDGALGPLAALEEL